MWPFELWLSPDICSGVASFKTSCFIVSLKSKQLCQFYPKNLIVIFNYWHLILDKDIFFKNLISGSQLLSIIYALNFTDVFKMYIDISKISSFLAPWSENVMAIHSSTLVWKIPWAEEPGRLQSMGSQRVGQHWVTSLSLFTFLHWRRKWQPSPVFLPGESQGLQSLVGCRLWGWRVGHNWSDLAAAAVAAPWWWRKCQPTPVLMPGESQGQRSLAGYSPWGHKSWTWLSY